MALPTAVKKQVAEADALYERLYNADGTAKTQKQLENADAKAAAAQAEEAPQAPAEEIVAEAPVPQPAPVAAPDSAQPDEQPWEQRFNSLRGRYDADTNTMRTQIAGLTEQIQGLTTALAKQAPAPQEAPAAEAPADAVKRLLSDEEIDEYGEELIDVVQRAAREVFQPTINQLQADNEQLRNQMGEVSTSVVKSGRQKLLEGMDASVSGWRDTNTSPEFLQWLQALDPYSGEMRHTLLKRAFEGNDLARVSAFFKGYLSETDVLNTAGQATAHTPQRQAHVKLDTLVAPGAAREVGTPQEGQKRQWTQAQIGQFYRDKTAGRYKGENGMAKAAALEADIIGAGREGRIVP